MDAIIMPSNISLVETLRQDFPELTFHAGHAFEWDSSRRTIRYDSDDNDYEAHLLHELSHAVLNHNKYDKDIDLIGLERDAWQYARLTLAPLYHVTVDADTIQDDMDTYREWLHARSTCPNCEASGIQIKKHTYKCVACQATWRVNEARVCALRRYVN